MVVPVIAFKNLRTSSKQFVELSNAQVGLLSESRKITNLILSLTFSKSSLSAIRYNPVLIRFI